MSKPASFCGQLKHLKLSITVKSNRLSTVDRTDPAYSLGADPGRADLQEPAS
jgi:hypothetical protein